MGPSLACEDFLFAEHLPWRAEHQSNLIQWRAETSGNKVDKLEGMPG